MGIYRRRDSQFYWYLIEGTTVRRSTGVPIDGGSPAMDKELRRQATEIYAVKRAEAAKRAAGLTVAPASITFTAYARWYTTHIAAHRRSSSRDVSILKRLEQSFGPEDLAAIDAHRVREWMTARLKDRVKPATVNRELDVLKAMLHTAVPRYLTRSPLSDVRRLRVPEHERRVLTREEEQRILAVADDDARALIVVALDSLLRLSSVILLQWPQVKLDRGIIVPLNAKVSQDYVPITTRMREALDRLPRDGPWVFARLHRTGHGPTAAKNRAIRLFDNLCRNADVPHGRARDGVTFHCLRHTGASRALQAGASVRTVMKLGGWKDIRTVLRYTHAADIDVRLAAESIGRPITSPAREPDLPRKDDHSAE